MTQFKVYVNSRGAYEAVKQGWSWPAFFLGFIWALVKKMWILGIGAFIVFLGFSYCSFALFFIDVNENIWQVFFGIMGIGILILPLIFGFYGNKWREKFLAAKGFDFKEAVTAADGERAIALHAQESAPPAKDTKQGAIIRGLAIFGGAALCLVFSDLVFLIVQTKIDKFYLSGWGRIMNTQLSGPGIEFAVIYWASILLALSGFFLSLNVRTRMSVLNVIASVIEGSVYYLLFHALDIIGQGISLRSFGGKEVAHFRMQFGKRLIGVGLMMMVISFVFKDRRKLCPVRVPVFVGLVALFMMNLYWQVIGPACLVVAAVMAAGVLFCIKSNISKARHRGLVSKLNSAAKPS